MSVPMDQAMIFPYHCFSLCPLCLDFEFEFGFSKGANPSQPPLVGEELIALSPC